MLTKRLLIMSESISKKRFPAEPIPALDRYTGIYFKVVKKLKKERKIHHLDIIILSQRSGLLWSYKRVPYYEPSRSTDEVFGKLSLSREEVERHRKENVAKLERILSKRSYSRIIVNVGKNYLRLIEGFKNPKRVPVVYVPGTGLGPKAKNLGGLLLTG